MGRVSREGEGDRGWGRFHVRVRVARVQGHFSLKNAFISKGFEFHHRL